MTSPRQTQEINVCTEESIKTIMGERTTNSPTKRPFKYHILKHFGCYNLHGPVGEVYQAFEELANSMATGIKQSHEVSAGLRKLLEARDCFVRAASTGK